MILLAAIILGLTGIIDAETAGVVRMRSLRLPNDTFPLSYHLHIATNIHQYDLSFNGNVTIDVQIRQSTNEIVLHAKNLSDFQIIVRLLDNNEIAEDLTHTYDKYTSFLIIHPRENYQAFEEGQRYRIQILYKGIIQSQTFGLYWMAYEDVLNNRTTYVAATQSEPTYARLVLPCYDEPAFKSNFTIELTHCSSYTAISNMPVKHLRRHGVNGELTTTLFYSTPPMSTYLMAFVISNFQNISETYRGVTQRIFTPPTSQHKGELALKNAVRTVAALEDYFGIRYPLEKLDHIALKNNYGAAMENWGLITYKEDNLIHLDTTDVHKKLRDTLTQSHEIAHQWFGNLVSPEWWTYAWMNEGFATYFSYVITDMLYPEEKVMEFFITEIAERAYSFNFMAVRPMTYYVERERDIMGVFDIISYQRAACVIKMFHHAFQQTTFVHGISNYLKKFHYSVANEMLLFDSLQEAVLQNDIFKHQPWRESVSEIMRTWTHSEWIPIVSVTRNYENGTITFSQRSKEKTSLEHWWIPLNFATSQDPDFGQTYAQYFMPPQPQITVSLDKLGLQLNGRDWVIVNKQQTGFYHILYDTDNLRAIARQLQQNHSVIHSLNRGAIFQDLTPLVEHNDFDSIEVVLDLIKYLEFEEDLTPWNLVADTIEFFEHNLYGTGSHVLFKSFVRRLVAPIFRRLFGNSIPSSSSTNTAMLAGQKILQMACLADLQECLDYTHAMAHDYIFKMINFQTESEYYAMYDIILCMGLRYPSDAEFNAILTLLQKSQRNTMYFDDLLYSLRCTQDRVHIRQFLEVLIPLDVSHQLMSDHESMMYLFYLYKSNIAARPTIWHFFDKNVKLLSSSPFFIEQFNRIAEYMPHHQKAAYMSLRQKIADELQPNATERLMDLNSNRLGKKIRNREQFLEKFEQRIYNWLHREQPEEVVSEKLSVGNGSNRLTGVWHTAEQLLRRALHVSSPPPF